MVLIVFPKTSTILLHPIRIPTFIETNYFRDKRITDEICLDWELNFLRPVFSIIVYLIHGNYWERCLDIWYMLRIPFFLLLLIVTRGLKSSSFMFIFYCSVLNDKDIDLQLSTYHWQSGKIIRLTCVKAQSWTERVGKEEGTVNTELQ